VVAKINNLIQTTNTDLMFEVTIGPDCSQDEITLFSGITDFTYYIRASADLRSMTPLFKQSVFGCGKRCMLIETGVVPTGYQSPAIFSFDKYQPQAKISTSDTSLHGTSIELTIRCEDPQSETASASEETTATVTFYDPCYDTEILQEEI